MEKKKILKIAIPAAIVFMAVCAVVLYKYKTRVGKLSEPVKGETSATVYCYAGDFNMEQKLLVNGMPQAVASTLPELYGIQTSLLVNGQVTGEFERQEAIRFDGSDYTALEGIVTFRGNNYRSSAVYGIADINEKKFDTSLTWNIETGRLKKTVKDGYWTGSCWTGQPLIVRWDEDIKQNMNLYEDKKAKKDLVEVIYSTADGNIYFLDLDDGSATRDKISLGFPIKGTGSIYPSGVPLYFVGAGDSMGDNCARAFIIDLLKGEVIYEYGYNDEYSDRTDNNKFHAYDSSPLIDVETDTLIQPGENGILYTMKLNTVYDGKSVSVNPGELVKWKYTTDRSRKDVDTYWLGMESSAAAWNGYLYIADNCGDLFCIDINSMEVIWIQDLEDDSNASPVFEMVEEDGTGYIYISTSLHWTADSKSRGSIPVLKINAATGEKVWERRYDCYTVSGVSGGVQATALLGQNNISDLVYFAIARTGGESKGRIVALSKETGEEVWACVMSDYTWSSPIALYDENGDGYVILCDSTGNMYMLDGRTGELYDTFNLGGDNIEASCAAFENTIVVGTRGRKIYGVYVK